MEIMGVVLLFIILYIFIVYTLVANNFNQTTLTETRMITLPPVYGKFFQDQLITPIQYNYTRFRIVNNMDSILPEIVSLHKKAGARITKFFIPE